MRSRGFGDSASIVPHLDKGFVSPLRQLQPDASARRRVLDGVVQQIHDRPFDPLGIAIDLSASFSVEMNRDFLLCGYECEGFDDVLE